MPNPPRETRNKTYGSDEDIENVVQNIMLSEKFLDAISDRLFKKLEARIEALTTTVANLQTSLNTANSKIDALDY